MFYEIQLQQFMLDEENSAYYTNHCIMSLLWPLVFFRVVETLVYFFFFFKHVSKFCINKVKN